MPPEAGRSIAGIVIDSQVSAFYLCQPELLEELVRGVFRGRGAPAGPATESARHLIRANLFGHDSRGVIRVAQYVALAEGKKIAEINAGHVLADWLAAAL